MSKKFINIKHVKKFESTPVHLICKNTIFQFPITYSQRKKCEFVPFNIRTRTLLINKMSGGRITGSSVVAMTYNGGLIMGADTLGSYGSLAKYGNFSRLLKINDYTVLGISGDLADFQEIYIILNNLMINDRLFDDGVIKTPKEIHSYLTRLLYHKFLGYVDLRGLSYTDTTLCSGLGAHLARPILRRIQEEKKQLLVESDAYLAIDQCLKVLLYRDCRTINKFEIAVVNAKGVTISEPFLLDTNWDIAQQV
ncbi:hypothetical protein HZS_4063, partial [Henneguya salminicola]